MALHVNAVNLDPDLWHPLHHPKMNDIAHHPEDDEIRLLGLLQTIVDNQRLLVIGPIVAGLLALGGASEVVQGYAQTIRVVQNNQK